MMSTAASMVPGSPEGGKHRAIWKPPEFLRMVSVLMRARWPIAAGTVIVFLAGLASLFLLNRIYEVRASLLLKLGWEMAAPTTISPGEASPASKRPEDLATEIEIMKSPHLMEQVLDHFGEDYFLRRPPPKTPLKRLARYASDQVRAVRELAEDLLDRVGLARKLSRREKLLAGLQASLAVEPARRSDVLNVTLRTPDPAKGRELLEELLELYLQNRRAAFRTTGAIDLFRGKVEQLRQQLEQAEAERDAFKLGSRAWAAPEQRQQLIDWRQRVHISLAENQANASRLAVELTELQRSLERLPPTLRLSTVEQRNVLLDTLRRQLIDLEAELERRRARYEEGNRLVREAREEIERLKAAIAAEERMVTDSITTGPNQELRTLEQLLVVKRSERAGLLARAVEEQAQLADIERRIEEIDRAETIANRHRRAVELLEASYLAQVKSQEKAEIAEAMEERKIYNVTVISPPTAGLRPVSPSLRITLLGSLLLGLGGSVFVALLADALRPRVYTVADAADATDAPLAAIPEDAGLRRGAAPPGAPPAVARELNRLLARLPQLPAHPRRLGVIAPAGGEGAATVCAWLAGAIAEDDTRRVLLADARPGAPAAFRLRGGATGAPGAEQSAPLPVRKNLHVLEARPGDAKTDGDGYDVVVWNAPPLAELATLAPLTGGIDELLLVIASGKTRKDELQIALDQLGAGGATVAGVILNRSGRFVPRFLR